MIVRGWKNDERIEARALPTHRNQQDERTIDHLDLLGNYCPNHSNYEYADTEMKKAISAIEVEVEVQKAHFTSAPTSTRFSF